MNTLPRDVAINVIANLVAGAIIYLGGVVGGLFPVYQTLVIFATVILSAFGVWLLWPLYIAYAKYPEAIGVSSVRQQRALQVMMVLVMLVLVAAPIRQLFFILNRSPQAPRAAPWLPAVRLPMVAVILIVIFFQYKARMQQYRARLAAQQDDEDRIARHLDVVEIYRGRRHRRMASREPRIVRRPRGRKL